MKKILKNSPIYPIEKWRITEKEFDIETNYLDETIFSIGNGYIGIRGNFEEGYNGPGDTTLDGTYINGFYESEPIVYGEKAHGFGEVKETMLNVTNSKIIKLFIGNEEFDLLKGNIIDYKRVLDMKNGVLIRNIIWESPIGKRVKITIKRVAPFENKHLLAIDYQITPLNFSGEITLESAIDGDVRNQESKGDPRVGSSLKGQALKVIGKEQIDGYGALIQETINSQFVLICAMDNELETNNDYKIENNEFNQRLVSRYKINCKKGEKVKLNKYITYYTSRDYPIKEVLSRAKVNLYDAQYDGFNKLLRDQRRFLDEFWNDADIKINGDDVIQQGIRFNLFHLLQSVGRDGKTNIAAKGLTGEGYEGHYFWDTETYILPFFLFTEPEISKKLLKYRYNILDRAKQRAKDVAHNKGALYPWRTIDGRECSAFFPAGTAQYHINADIIYALKQYVEVTEDKEFLLDYGAEMLFETARLWEDLGGYVQKKDNKFCINSVTGPDEYTAIVNNNFYTNSMAKMHLDFAYKTAMEIKNEYSNIYQRLVEKIGLNEKEIKSWKKAADNMYLPYDEELGIHPQDDNFLEKEVWDFENVSKDKYPLLLNYHPLIIYRYQVCKQADVVLALFLLGNKFDKQVKKRDFDYYEKITSHDSSLSNSIHSVIASEIGYYKKAYDYFLQTARTDLDNYHKNSEHGVHTACMAGTWMCVVNGFGGMRVYNGELIFNPHLPDKWDSYKFKIRFKMKKIEIKVKKNEVKYTLLEGDELTFKHKDDKINLKHGESVRLPLKV
ncbi:MAG: glycoside hydrolase family 65 protein [Firmicutes bacterium]|nr:glycoside hydrolase family 65 protein [Bacillota bacterium]